MIGKEASLDFERIRHYELTIRSTDYGTPAMSIQVCQNALF